MNERGTYRLLVGDVRERLLDVAPGSVQTCVTSPPYWALRSYATGPNKGLEIGAEPTPEAYIASLVEVFGLVRRTLREDGTLWLNLGDSYESSGGKLGRSASPKQRTNRGSLEEPAAATGLADGSPLLIPHRVALALQADGWRLRQTVIWHKRSPMPESVTGWRWVRCRVKVVPGGRGGNGKKRMMEHGNRLDGKSCDTAARAVWTPCPGCDKCLPHGGWRLRKARWRPTTGHEYVFLFSKNETYFADSEAAAEPVSDASRGGSGNKAKRCGENETTERREGTGEVERHSGIPWQHAATRNPRSVLSLSSENYKGAHFAVFPTSLVRWCLRATAPAAVCGKCGAPFAPMVAAERVATRPGENTKCNKGDAIGVIPGRLDSTTIGNRDPQRHVSRAVVSEYRSTCQCGCLERGRAVVLDPFAGSGTTIQVATWYGLDAVGIELIERYAELARERIDSPPRCLLWERPTLAKAKHKASPAQGNLF